MPARAVLLLVQRVDLVADSVHSRASRHEIVQNQVSAKAMAFRPLDWGPVAVVVILAK